MNGAETDTRPPGLHRFLEGPEDDVVESLFLAAYSRRPTAEEAKLASEFLNDSRESEPAAGLLWALLNSSEFVLNH